MMIDNHIKLILESKNTKKSKINQISKIVHEAYQQGKKDAKTEICDVLGINRKTDQD